MRNIRMVLQYEGTRYQGWQRQVSSDNTIQGKLEQLLSRVLSEEIEVSGSGRTDAGVHAKGQVANFHTKSNMSLEELQETINRYLPEDIAVVELAEASSRFHSRLNACGKRYCYRIVHSKVPDVFLRRFSFQVREALDLEAMRQGASYLCGEHDFKAFTSAKKGKKSTVRRIDSIEIAEKQGLLTMTFEGNGFLHHMVRILVGTLLEIGQGKRMPESVKALLIEGDRAQAGFLAPAKGLTLEKVFF